MAILGLPNFRENKSTMSEKAYTIVLTSNSSTKVKSITIPKSWVRMALFFVGVIFVLLFCLVIDYFNVLSNYSDNSSLKSQNIILKQKFKLVESKVLNLEKTLQRVKGVSLKINHMANIPAPKLNEGTKVIQPMGPIQATVTPISSLFEKLKFIKKAPFARLDQNKGHLNVVNELEIKVDNLAKSTHLEEQSALTLWENMSHRKTIFDATPNMRPVKDGWYTSKFGLRSDPFTGHSVMHSGLDIAAAPGTPVYAPANGLVSYVGYEDGYGNLVTIDHGYGVKTRYAHNSEIHVKYGQTVNRGDKIASVGSTGRSSGYHLHYEVRVNGVAVDPKNYIIE